MSEPSELILSARVKKAELDREALEMETCLNKEQEQQRELEQKRDSGEKISTKRVTEFINLMQEHEAPTTDLFSIDFVPGPIIRIDKRMGFQDREIRARGNYIANLQGKGWGVKPYQRNRQISKDEIKQPVNGIIILSDGRIFAHEDLDSVYNYGAWTTPHTHDKDSVRITWIGLEKLIDRPLFAGDEGLDMLGWAVAKYGIVE